jgi:hypothetical protein
MKDREIPQFISELVNKSESIQSEYSQIVSDNFWDLIAEVNHKNIV